MRDREAAPLPVRLVCPPCRRPGPGSALTVSCLEPASDATGAIASDRCPRCGTTYPRIDGMSCVPPDLEAFRRTQAEALGPGWVHDDAAAASEACIRAAGLDPGGELFRELSLLASTALSHFPGPGGVLESELAGNRALLETAAAWLEEAGIPSDVRAGCALEAGCGPGALLHAVAPLFPRGAVGLDLRVGALRLARRVADRGRAFLARPVEGCRFEPLLVERPPQPARGPATIHFVQGDVLDPPFEAEVFSAVLAVSLLDTVPEPFVALGQLDALLAPGGLLLLATPYAWDARVTPPAGWLSRPGASGSETLRALLAGGHPALPQLRYELFRESRRIPWAVPGQDRLVFRYFLDVLLARKA